MNPSSLSLAAAQEEYLISMRRHFHQHPEISHQEVETCAEIRRQLDAMGIPHETVGETNVIGFIDTHKPGKTLAIRADIDALPIAEETGLPFASQTPGMMHACGHDAHTALLLAAAKSIMEIQGELTGKIYLCFQCAEETGGGASEIVAYLKEKGGVDLVFGTHVHASVPKGVFACPAGPMMAGAARWEITVNGRGGHGSRPDEAVNPLFPACDILPRVAAIPVNRHAPFDVCVISPCLLRGGTASNIIPDTAEIAGTIRYFKYGDEKTICGVMEEIAEHVAASYGASAQVHLLSGNTPPVVNDPKSVAFACETVAELGNMKVFDMGDPATGSGNFGAFLEAFPGFYCVTGVKSPREGASSNHHNSKFDLDETALAGILAFFIHHTRRFLAQ